jgi:hypothetical protein
MPMNDDRRRKPGLEEADHLIEEALRALTAAPPVDLRARVLVELGRAPARPTRPRRLLLSPRVVATALLAMAVVTTVTVWLSQARRQTPRPASSLAMPLASSTVAPAGFTAPSEPVRGHLKAPRAGSRARRAAPADLGAALTSARPTASTKVASGNAWASADLVVDLDDSPGPHLPGAPAGDLGDPIAPLPHPRPIVIPPIAPLPIVTAPPVSELGAPVSAPSNEGIARESLSPGKNGGSCP